MDTAGLGRRLEANVARVILGKPEAVRRALVPLLCRGHLLIEDVPGVGKTTLARAIARSVRGDVRRVQFTPDLLPMDLTGSAVFNQKTNDFEFRPGPVFTHILLADEINRATPRTQSALLECMEEGRVSVDGVTRALPPLFFVMATLNPVEQSGTFDLPETQLDRFMVRITMGYPTVEDEVRIFDQQRAGPPVETLQPVLSLEEVMALQEAVPAVHVEDSVKRYAADLVRATREHGDAELGAGPRGTLHLLRASQAMALLSGEPFVSPDTIKALAPAVLGHRVVVRAASALRGARGDDVVSEVLRRVPVPVRSNGSA